MSYHTDTDNVDVRHSDTLQGRTDASMDSQDAATQGTWVIAGIFLGIIAIVWSLLYIPKIEIIRIDGKSAEYVTAYRETFRSQVRTKQLMAALLGSLSWVAIYILYLLWG